MTVRRTGEIASVLVGEGLLGRVINVLGEPIDGAGPISGERLRMPLERKSPGRYLPSAREAASPDRYQGHRLDGAHRPRTA